MEDDGDIIKGLGFVTLYASYLEEQVDALIKLLSYYKEYKGGWQISSKIKHAKTVVKELGENEFCDLITDLDLCLTRFEERNTLIHGRIYASFNRPDMLKSSRENTPDRVVTSAELYALAKGMDDLIIAIYRPMIFQIPKALKL